MPIGHYLEHGETWVPYHIVWKLYKIKKDRLDELVRNKTIRFEIEHNPHNDMAFKVYSIVDLDKYVLGCKSKDNKHKKDEWLYS